MKTLLFTSRLISAAIFFFFNISLTAEMSDGHDKSVVNSSVNNQEASYQSEQMLTREVTQTRHNSPRDVSRNRVTHDGPVEDPEGDAMQRKIFNGANTGDRFGNSVSSAGDVNNDGYDDLIVAAPDYSSNTGRVYIYYGGLTIGMSNDTADVVITGQAVNNNFGFQVAAAGDVNNDGFDDVIVGADEYSSGTGRAYVYFGGAGMNNVADVVMTGEAVNNFFGTSVSSAGDVNNDGYDDVIVGARGYSSNTGRAYIFFGGAVMNNAADLTITGEAASNFLGRSVSTAGDVNNDGYSDVIVGARGYSSSTGRAYVFLGDTVMNNIADIIMTGETANNFFGRSVSSAGDVNGDGYSDVIAGADGYSSDSGRAYVFFGGAVMNNAPDVIMKGEAAGNNFGFSVSSAGDLNGDGYSDVIVGEDRYTVNTGRAYVFFGSAFMNNSADVILTGEASGDRFGFSVSSAGDVNDDGYSEVIAGAFGNSSNKGRAYIYDYSMRNDIIYDVTLTGDAAANSFGLSVSSAGDVNGDGYSDVIVGGTAFGLYDDTGWVYVYFGGEVIDNVADVIMKGTSNFNSFGYSVSSAGDVNGDGYSDVIVGEDQDPSLLIPDKAYIYFGGAVMNNVADVILTDPYPSPMGTSVSSAGDVNGDGYSDVIVGNWDYIGKAYIYFGGVSMDNSADVTMTGEANKKFGFSVSSAGDVNGDGYSDVVVGAPADPFTSDIGKVYIFFGGVVMNNSADVTMSGEAAGNHFGSSVSPAGDVNHDGYSDVIVGAERYAVNMGKAYIYFGGAVMNNSADVIMSDFGVSRFGTSVSSTGDMNGDGCSDVIIGAPQSASGKAYVYFGGTVMNNSADIIMTGEVAGNHFGTSVSSTGDMNGDGYSDVIAGAPFFTPAGRAYIYLASAISSKPTLNLTMFIEGFYDPVNDLQVKDTITVELRNSASLFAIADQTKAVVSANGTVQLRFLNAPSGDYYLVVKHRNSIETWSAHSLAFSQTTPLNYDLSSSSSQAFGGNMIQIDTSPLRYGIYSGDVNQSGTVDLNDIVLSYNASSAFTIGYVVTDLSGDNFVNLNDILIAYNNSAAFVAVIKP